MSLVLVCDGPKPSKIVPNVYNDRTYSLWIGMCCVNHGASTTNSGARCDVGLAMSSFGSSESDKSEARTNQFAEASAELDRIQNLFKDL